MKRLFKFLLFFTTLLLWDFNVWAANISDVVINEIAWMGTNVSYNDEWIELYNSGDAIVNLEGWTLKAGDGAPEINLSGTIPGQGFFLLERTNDDTVPNISADLIYKGALRNDGENLGLYDVSGSLIDQVNSLEGWPAGDNTTKQTMERTSSGWQTSQEPGGTPKRTNSELIIEVRPRQIAEVGPLPAETTKETEETGSLTETRSLEPKFTEARPLYIYPRGVVFNEILPSPDGPDEENEWIEIYNENDFEIDLSQWKIQDTIGKSTAYTLNKKIPALGYLVFLRPETKITLNNDGDGLNLINPKGEIIDSIFFGKALLNQSYAKAPSGWAWTTNLTPGEKNIISVSAASTVKSLNQKQTTEKKSQELGIKNQEKPQKIISLATASTPQFSVFLIAFIIALFCSIAFLIIKNNLKSFGG